MPKVTSIEIKAREAVERISNERLPEVYNKQADVYEMQVDIIEDIIDILNELHFKEVIHMNTNPLVEQIAYLSKEVGDKKKLVKDMRSKL